MTKPNLLVVAPSDLYALKVLNGLSETANINIASDSGSLERLGSKAEVVLYSSLGGTIPSIQEVWKRTQSVKWIHSLSAGVEKLLFPEFAASEVPLTNARGVFKRSLADFAVLGILYFYKHVRRMVESQRAHKWDQFQVEWIPGKVMGVVGYGEIGRECALLAHGLGIKIHAVRRNTHLSQQDEIVERIFEPGQLKDMLAGADIVLAAAPLTPETRHMLSVKEFAAMKKSAIVMNVGRGPVIDEQALIHALQNKQIAGAALDVFEEEPLKADHPFWDMENVLISPHCTDRTHNPDWLELSMQFFVENFQRYVKGEPLQNLVDKKAGY